MSAGSGGDDHRAARASAPRPADVGERLDLQDPSIEESAAADGHCGTTDPHTGRVCQEPHAHTGTCVLVAPSPEPSAGAPGTR